MLMPFVAERVFGWLPANIDSTWGLRDVGSGMAYSVCNTLKCDACELLFLDIRFDDDEMNRLYSGYRESDYNRMREKYEPGYTERNTWRESIGFSHISDVEVFLLKNLNYSHPTPIVATFFLICGPGDD